MTSWNLHRDELSSVSGLMSIMGSFDINPNGKDCGLEKRLELDVVPHAMLNVSDADWAKLCSLLNESVRETKKGNELSLYNCDKCVVVVSPSRVILTCSAEAMLHVIIGPLLSLCTKVGCSVEWASFMRKNRTSSWDDDLETNQVMAGEFLELKTAFPKGTSHLFGPLDGDHYFYFVYDAIDRSTGTMEDDVQVNLVMYGTKGDALRHDVNKVRHGAMQRCVTVRDPNGTVPDAYETIRHFDTANGAVATYETNATVHIDHERRIQDLLREYEPERFTVMTLFDPHSVLAKRQLATTVEGYTVENRATNEFAAGYVICKSMFMRNGKAQPTVA